MNKLQKVTIGLILPVVLLLSGCAVGGTNNTNTKVPAAAQPSSAPALPMQKKLGEVVTYTDGLSVSVSLPAPYAPSAQAAGVVEGNTSIVFNVVITNNTKKNIDIAGYPSVNSGGISAIAITDFENQVGSWANTTLLPTQSLSFKDGYSVKDQADITYLITPGLAYQQAIFTSK